MCGQGECIPFASNLIHKTVIIHTVHVYMCVFYCTVYTLHDQGIAKLLCECTTLIYDVCKSLHYVCE